MSDIASPKGRHESALQILSIDDTNKLAVNQQNVDEIVRRLNDAGASKLSIVSVAGSFRTGKSFLLNLMVKYLTHHEGRTLSETTDWCSGQVSKREYFQWAPGVNRKTLGIWMYTRPFIRIVNGSRVGVVLMDTQGLWDGESGYSLLTSIFGMSSVISSVQVYNLMRTVELDKLDQIKWFTGFGEGAIQQCLTESSRTEPAPAFQTLHLLVRDWVGFTNAGDAELCREETRQFLDTQRKQKEFGKFLAELENVYMTVDAVMLPPPGAACCFDTEFRGKLKSVDDAFLAGATRYFHALFAKPIIKQFNGNPVVPDALGEIVTQFATIFRDAQVPESLSFAGAMVTTVNMCAREAAHNNYRRSMLETVSSGSTPVPTEELETKHVRAQTKALAVFSRSATYGGAAAIEAERAKLKDAIAVSFEDMKLRNQRNQRCGLNPYAPYVAAAVAAVVTDKTSDVACDWWSSSCRDLSGVLFNFYGYGFLILAALVAHFSVKNGSVITVQAMVELGEEVKRIAALSTKQVMAQVQLLSVNSSAETFPPLAKSPVPLATKMKLDRSE